MTRAASYDPEGTERGHLLRMVDLADARVLEIGCGNGRVAAHYAEPAALAVGIDPDRPEIADVPLLGVQATALALPFRKHCFDTALLGWSL